MKEYIFKDADTLASGEKANIITVHAKSPKDALAIIKRQNSLNRFYIFGKVFVASATWTESTKTLTKTGGFSRYVFANSTRIIITSGTGATAGEYVIASRTSDNAIVLATSIGAGADGQTDIGAYIIAGRTATRIERTNDDPRNYTPGVGYSTAGVSLAKGVAPSRMLFGVVSELAITAA